MSNSKKGGDKGTDKAKTQASDQSTGMGQPEKKDLEAGKGLGDELSDQSEPVQIEVTDGGPGAGEQSEEMHEAVEEVLHQHPTTPAHEVLAGKILYISSGKIGRFSDKEKIDMILDLAKQCDVRKYDYIPDDVRLPLVLELLSSVASIAIEIPKEILTLADIQIGKMAVDTFAEEIGMTRMYCGDNNERLVDREAWPGIRRRIRSERKVVQQKDKCNVCPGDGHCSIQNFLESHPSITEEDVLELINNLTSSGSIQPGAGSHSSRMSRGMSISDMLSDPKFIMNLLTGEGSPFSGR